MAKIPKKTKKKKTPPAKAKKPTVLPAEVKKDTSKKHLVTADPLQRYMNQIAQYPLLTAEEEHELALRYHDSADAKAAYELTVKNLRLVVKIAMEYRRAWSNVLDLIQEGNVGLMTAIQKFDPYRQTRISTYASWWIRAYILKFIMSNWRLIKIGNTQAERKLFYNLKKEQQKLLEEGFVPGPKLLAERLNVNEKDVIEMSKRMGSSELSIDLPRYSGDDGSAGPSLGETISEDDESLDENLANEQLRGLLNQATQEIKENLDKREKFLLDKRLLAESPLTLREIGEAWGISRERVRQLEARLLKKIKAFIEEKYPDLSLDPE